MTHTYTLTCQEIYRAIELFLEDVEVEVNGTLEGLELNPDLNQLSVFWENSPLETDEE